ncbi:hypothetical protein [Paenibacillus albidus]|uniref:hypothetical protein n=1 Tax=Paenibacillus albidus TaxID=2041023 RepID=UPI00166355DD|nr:hypothetical protein [Paenibacillus albidus]
MITAFIIGCEVAFWVFVLAGLTFRYILKQPRIGAVLLYSTPVVDLALIVATVLDLRAGTPANFAHSLSAIYIGASIAFGHSMINWADVRFAHRFAGGPKPAPKPKNGAAHARNERIGWLKHLLAYIIGAAVLYGMILFVDDAARTASLSNTIRYWAIILGIDFLISFSYTLWPKTAKEPQNKPL